MQLIVQNTLLILIVAVSAYTDLRYRKVFNKYTIPSILLGILIFTSSSGFLGLKSSLFGLLVGALILLIPFALGGMGAGDVKLLAAVGAIKGWEFVLLSFVHAAIVGGIIAIVYGIYSRGIKKSAILFISTVFAPLFKLLYQLTNIQLFGKIYAKLIGRVSTVEKLYIPYAVPIALGSILVLLGFNLLELALLALR